MKVTVTPAHALTGEGQRLDASYHASPGVKALRTLRDWASAAPAAATDTRPMIREAPAVYTARRLDRLAEVCVPGGVFIGGRSKRIYVDDPERGIPFLSSSDMLMASFDGVKLISKKQPELDSLILRKGWTLISRSGTIGNIAYVRQDMDGLAGSEHIMRVAPDPDKIPPGYLYAFLSSRLGTDIIKAGTFGSVIDTIDPERISNLPIPRLDAATEERIHGLIEQAAQLRAEANQELTSIRHDISRELDLPEVLTPAHDHAFAVGIPRAFSGPLRLDAFYHIGYAGIVADYQDRLSFPTRRLGEVADDVFEAPVFKRVHVDESGIPYLMGYEVYHNNPKPTLFLSRSIKNVDQYVLRSGMVVVQNAGQRYGLIGTPTFITRTIDGMAATNNMLRIVVADQTTSGFMYAFLSTEVGSRLLLRESYGSSLPHIFAQWVANILLPWPEASIRESFGRRVVVAFEMRATANEAESAAETEISRALR